MHMYDDLDCTLGFERVNPNKRRVSRIHPSVFWLNLIYLRLIFNRIQSSAVMERDALGRNVFYKFVWAEGEARA